MKTINKLTTTRNCLSKSLNTFKSYGFLIVKDLAAELLSSLFTINHSQKSTDAYRLFFNRQNSKTKHKVTCVDTRKALSLMNPVTVFKLRENRFINVFHYVPLKLKHKLNSQRIPVVTGPDDKLEIRYNEKEIIVNDDEDKKIINELIEALERSKTEFNLQRQNYMIVHPDTCIHARSNYRADFLINGFNIFIPRAIFDQLNSYSIARDEINSYQCQKLT